MEILTAVLTLGFLGLIFGIGLAIASKRLAVKVDERLEKVSGLLPGANCGACGGAGCFGFAEGLLKGDFSLDACKVSEDETKIKIAEILGQKIEKKVKTIATLHCAGGQKVADRFVYDGIQTCVSANALLGGQKSCVWGCLGFGDCAKVCPFDAISMGSDGLPTVNSNCRACNKCVLICPKKLFSLIPVIGKVYVACSSHDSGRDTKVVCPVGCIACGLCVKACKFDAIHVVDNLAVIDYNKCSSCGDCVKVCPVHCIIQKD